MAAKPFEHLTTGELSILIKQATEAMYFPGCMTTGTEDPCDDQIEVVRKLREKSPEECRNVAQSYAHLVHQYGLHRTRLNALLDERESRLQRYIAAAQNNC